MSNIKYFPIFQRFPEIIHGISTRKGGVSDPPFHSLNLGYSTNDKQDNIRKNRERFLKKFNIREDQLAIPKQVHSDHVEVVMTPGIFKDTDALITNQKNLYLSVQTADCVPVIFYDPRFSIIGIAHSGWRGTSRNIVGKTISRMHSIFGCSPASIYTALGAGVKGPCYQVDEKTAMHFSDKYCIPDDPGHYKIDIQGIIMNQLTEAGVHTDCIEADETCTHCAADLYYSYRRDGTNSGRMMAIIGIN